MQALPGHADGISGNKTSRGLNGRDCVAIRVISGEVPIAETKRETCRIGPSHESRSPAVEAGTFTFIHVKARQQAVEPYEVRSNYKLEK